MPGAAPKIFSAAGLANRKVSWASTWPKPSLIAWSRLRWLASLQGGAQPFLLLFPEPLGQLGDGHGKAPGRFLHLLLQVRLALPRSAARSSFSNAEARASPSQRLVLAEA